MKSTTQYNLKFDKPQRQSVVGIVIMFTDSLQKFFRASWALIAITLYRMPAEAIGSVIFAVIGIFLVIGFVAYLRYRNFTFFLDELKQEFIVHSGVFSKKRLTIGLDKIQQVNINQNVIQKLIGVYSLDVDTAGSGAKEVSIKAIDHAAAQILKSRLLEKAETTKQILEDEIDAEKNPAEELVVKISLLSLLKVGITSNYGRSLGVLIAFFFTIYDNVSDFVQNEMLSEEQVQEYVTQGASIGFFVLFFTLFVLTFIITLVRTIIKYFDLEVVRQRVSLLVTYGLFAKKNTLLNPKKAQIVSYSQNFFQQKMDVLRIKIRQASSDQIKGEAKQSVGSVIEIPGASKAEKDRILKLIYEKSVEKGAVINPNYRYVLRGIYLGVITPVFLFVLIGFFINPELQSFFPLIGLYVLIAGLFIFFGFKNYRLFISQDFVVKKNGAWDVKHQIIEPHKIQAISTRQFFWHKRSDVGHVVLHTAGGDIYFSFANFSQINNCINYWLYQVESSDKYWM